MDEIKIDRAAMGRLAKALTFISGPAHPTTVALKAAADSGSDGDIKKARTLFLRLKAGDRRAALSMLADCDAACPGRDALTPSGPSAPRPTSGDRRNTRLNTRN